MIHVKSIEFIDFGNIESLLMDFSVHDLLIVKGANGAGKSTAIEGIWQILRQKFPAKPVKDGKKKGAMSMVLDDGTKIEYLAVRQDDGSFTEGLTVTNASGRALGKAEQTAYLRQLIGGVGSGFDVNEFLRVLGTKPAREMLGKLSIQCGADIQAIEKAKFAYDGVFKDRTEAKNKWDAQKARATPFDEELAAKSPIDAAELSRQKSEIEEHNGLYKDQIGRLEMFKQDVRVVDEEIDNTVLQIQALQKRLEDQKARKASIQDRVQNGEKWLQDPANKPKSTEAIDSQLSDLTATNEAISDAKRLAREHDEARRLQMAWETCDQAVKAAEKAKTEAVAACKLPAGLSFDESGEDLNYTNPAGVTMPLVKASEAQKIRIGIELQLSQMGELGLCTVNCSALDPLMLKELGEMLRAKGIDGAFEVRANTLAEMGLHIELLEEHLGLPAPAPKSEGNGTLFS